MFEKHPIIPKLESSVTPSEAYSDAVEVAPGSSPDSELTLPGRISLEDALNCVRDQGIDPVNAMIRAIKET